MGAIKAAFMMLEELEEYLDDTEWWRSTQGSWLYADGSRKCQISIEQQDGVLHYRIDYRNEHGETWTALPPLSALIYNIKKYKLPMKEVEDEHGDVHPVAGYNPISDTKGTYQYPWRPSR